ncbi:unnamed protein product [Rhodiola kirilowii]
MLRSRNPVVVVPRLRLEAVSSFMGRGVVRWGRSKSKLKKKIKMREWRLFGMAKVNARACILRDGS